MRSCLIIAVILITGMTLGAEVHEDSGKYGFAFLQMPVNPVSMALGGRGAFSNGNHAAFALQPAMPTVEANTAVTVSHAMWLDDTRFTTIAYSNSNRRNHFGLLYRNLDYGEIEIRDDNAALIGYYRPIDLAMIANYGHRISPTHYLGINGGLIYEKINTASAYGAVMDLGYTFLPPFVDSRISLAVTNLGISSRMNEERMKLPATMAIDISKGFEMDQNRIIFEGSVTKAVDDNWKGAVNTEIDLNSILFLRAGYKINYDAENVTAGFGIQWRGITVDYGWSPFTSQLNDTHFLGITYSF